MEQLTDTELTDDADPAISPDGRWVDPRPVSDEDPSPGDRDGRRSTIPTSSRSNRRFITGAVTRASLVG